MAICSVVLRLKCQTQQVLAGWFAHDLMITELGFQSLGGVCL